MRVVVSLILAACLMLALIALPASAIDANQLDLDKIIKRMEEENAKKQETLKNLKIPGLKLGSQATAGQNSMLEALRRIRDEKEHAATPISPSGVQVLSVDKKQGEEDEEEVQSEEL